MKKKYILRKVAKQQISYKNQQTNSLQWILYIGEEALQVMRVWQQLSLDVHRREREREREIHRNPPDDVIQGLEARVPSPHWTFK